MTAQNYARMKEQVSALFPDFDDKQVSHACHMISHGLRGLHQDIYEVELNNVPFAHEYCSSGYHTYFEVYACGKGIYVRVTVD